MHFKNALYNSASEFVTVSVPFSVFFAVPFFTATVTVPFFSLTVRSAKRPEPLVFDREPYRIKMRVVVRL